jgi:hypothetical protein
MPSVHILVNVGFERTVQRVLERWDDHLAGCLGVATYQSMLVRREVPAGTYVFSDLDRIPPADAAGVLALWDGLGASGRARLLNDPRRVRLRYDLLRDLFDHRLNDFNVYRVDEDLRSVRFPAFVRCEHDHGGPRTELLHSTAELEAALGRLRRRRSWRSQLLVTECAAEPGQDGLYRKYGALLVNGQVVAWHLIAGRSWLVKGSRRVINDGLKAEQRRYIDENPHAEALKAVFDRAHVDYGRIDYGFVGERMQVYEINTNPAIVGVGPSKPARLRLKPDYLVRSLTQAFRDLADPSATPGGMIAMPPRRSRLPALAYLALRRGQSLLARYAHRSGIR